MSRILIIDDDLTALDIVDYLFEDNGFEVIRKANGLSALESIDEAEPDIILIDLMMPEMNGQECVYNLRKKGIRVPIVAFTALDDPDVHKEAITAGCNMVITKSCKSSKLLSYIQDLIAAGQST